MPLSLITMPTTTLNSNRHSNSSGDSISPMLPLIKPGWVYVGNTYMLARNNYKYKKSSKSKFYKTSFDILRRHVVVDIYHAKKLLEKLLNESQNDSMIKSGHSGTVCYTEKECKALGKCVLLHDDLIAGIRQYTTLVHRWSIKVMMENNSRVLVGGDATSSSSNSSSSGNIISSNSNSNDDLINLDSIDDYYFEDKMECQPKCRWVCEKPVCEQNCEPVCLPPKCKNTCPPVVSPKCKTKCAKPDCIVECKKGCVKNNCPQCITKCKPSKCIVECKDPKVPDCKPECQNPICSWTCRKPECPKPKCKLVCEK